jgi:hypothetical protein
MSLCSPNDEDDEFDYEWDDVHEYWEIFERNEDDEDG